MNMIKLLFLLFLSSQFSYAQSLPKEWLLLIDCVQNNQKKLTPQNLTAINNSVSTFNTHLNHIPSDRVSPFMKALLYRSLLESPPVSISGAGLVSSMVIDYFFKTASKNKNSTCAFTDWLIESMESDYTTLKTMGGFSDNNSLGPKSPVLARSLTVQRYIAIWIDFLKSANSDKDAKLINYYASLIIQAERLIKSFFEFSPQQPNTAIYLKWSTDNAWVDQKSITAPTQVLEEKSAAEIIESNLPTNKDKNIQDPSTAIDELIIKKNQEQNSKP